MDKKLKKAGVIGAGVMGATIAAQLANVGIETVLLDIVLPELTEGRHLTLIFRGHGKDHSGGHLFVMMLESGQETPDVLNHSLIDQPASVLLIDLLGETVNGEMDLAYTTAP